MEISIDQGLLEAAHENLLKSIAEYNDRYGYLGADWDREVKAYYDAGKGISFSVYFEELILEEWVHFEPGEWSLDTYLWTCAERALERSLTDDRINDPLPYYIEIG